MTETGILPTRSESDDSLWLQLGGPGFETRVLDDILWIRAETSMLGYLNAPSPFDAQGWLNTGDLVESRDGALRILGRQSEVINVGGEKVSPSEIEDVILQVDNIEEVVVRHKANPLTGHVVVATVRTCYDEDDRAVAARVRAHCQQHLSPYKVPALIQVTRAELMGRRFKKIRQPDLSDTIDMELAGVG
jgi:acyl-CoA synthetase (AMP-forming)/AMP-acid ligase II